MTPAGLVYYPDVISRSEEDRLLSQIAQLTLEDVIKGGRKAKRKMTCFGWDYNSTRKTVSMASPMPDYLGALLETCCKRCGKSPQEFEQAIVTWYPHGYGIGPHADAEVFGSTVLGISLATTTTMLFRRSGEEFPLHLERRSLVVMTGPSRWEWTHEIEGRHVKETRWSVTYRSIQAPHRLSRAAVTAPIDVV